MDAIRAMAAVCGAYVNKCEKGEEETERKVAKATVQKQEALVSEVSGCQLIFTKLSESPIHMEGTHAGSGSGSPEVRSLEYASKYSGYTRAPSNTTISRNRATLTPSSTSSEWNGTFGSVLLAISPSCLRRFVAKSLPLVAAPASRQVLPS